MTDQLDELSRRPYLVRAMTDWMCDYAQTPHLVVNALAPGVQVPRDHVSNGRIILNIGPTATQGLQMDNEQITFNARFNAVEHSIVVPMAAVVGIYARESGQGMVFVPDDAEPPPDGGKGDSEGRATPEKPQGGRSHLKIVK